MVKRLINKVQDWLDDRLRSLVGRLTPDRRVILIVSMLVVFGGLSIYMTVSSIYNFGKDKGERLQIERIEALKLHEQESRRDSIRSELIKNFNYE
jgi:hypothetical protein